jgi:hypothetical protein
MVSGACLGTRFPDGTHCGDYGWHAKDCPAYVACRKCRYLREGKWDGAAGINHHPRCTRVPR